MNVETDKIVLDLNRRFCATAWETGKGEGTRISHSINKEMAAAPGRNPVQQPFLLWYKISPSSRRCGQRS